MAEYLVGEIINEDGTSFNPPENPLMDRWLEKYPPTKKPEFSQVCDGYSCIFCSRCPHGSMWKVPTEDKEEYSVWVKEYEQYMKLHNPSLR